MIQVDPGPPNGALGSYGLELTVLPDGRPRVFYGVGTSLRMGTCVDVGCTGIDVVEVLDTSPFQAGAVALSAAARGDGSPVIALYNSDPGSPESLGGEEQRLVWCEDPECATVVSTPMPQRRYFGTSLTSAPDGTVAVVDVVFNGPAAPVTEYIGFKPCEDPSCLDDPDTFNELLLLAGPGGARGGFDAEGKPTAPFFTEPAPNQVQLGLAICGDRECLDIQTQTVGTFPGSGVGIRPPLVTAGGDLILVYQLVPFQGGNTGGKITVTACSGSDCTEAVGVTNVVHENSPFAVSPFDGALGPEQLPRLVRTTTEGFVFISCDDPACTQFETSELVPYRAQSLLLATAGDGAAVVTTADGRDPSEGPNIAPGLWLLRCADPPCQPPDPPS